MAKCNFLSNAHSRNKLNEKSVLSSPTANYSCFAETKRKEAQCNE